MDIWGNMFIWSPWTDGVQEFLQKETETLPPLLDAIVADYQLSRTLRRWDAGEEVQLIEDQLTNWREQALYCCNVVLGLCEEAQQIQLRHRVRLNNLYVDIVLC